MATTVQWRDLTIATRQAGGDPPPFRLDRIDGWEGRPPGRLVGGGPRAGGHGEFTGQVWAGARTVTVVGTCWSAADRDQLLDDFAAAAAYGQGGGVLEPLVVTLAGRTLTAYAQLVDAAPALVRGRWGVGRFGFQAQWRCPDGRRYGDTLTASTGLPVDAGGLDFGAAPGGLVLPLDFGAAGVDGRITMANDGTAQAEPTLDVTGGMPAGFELLETTTGGRLRYEYPVNVGQFVRLNTATGQVSLDGDPAVDRSGGLTRRDWAAFHIPARGSASVLFSALTTGDAGARLSSSWAPSYW